MSFKWNRPSIALLLAMISCASTGCIWNTAAGPNVGLLGIPVPVSPFFQAEQEDRYWEQERYNRVPILGPLTAGGPAVALDPPSPDEVIRAMPSINGGVPFLWGAQRDNVRMTIEPIADYVDPPRVYPLIGPAQLHHAHYKCTIFYTETTHVGWPLPYTTVDEDAQEVVYIDHNHLHMVGNVDDGLGGF
jgi:hypothetical protein